MGLDFSGHVGEVLPYLFQHAQQAEEGVRNMVAECLGTLANIDPATVFGALKSHTGPTEADPYTRWTIATALKYSLSSANRSGKAAAFLADDKTLLQVRLLVHVVHALTCLSHRPLFCYVSGYLGACS